MVFWGGQLGWPVDKNSSNKKANLCLHPTPILAFLYVANTRPISRDRIYRDLVNRFANSKAYLNTRLFEIPS